MSELGKMIRLRRKQLGMTQKELAERAHVSQQMITALETGRIKRSTSLPELFRSLDLDISKAVNNAVSAPDYSMAYPLISKADYQAILSIIRNSLFEYQCNHYLPSSSHRYFHRNHLCTTGLQCSLLPQSLDLKLRL